MLPVGVDSAIAIGRIEWDGSAVVLEGRGVAAAAGCPACGVASDRVHDWYQRRPFDLPWRGRVVRLRLFVRCFRCVNIACERGSFVEDFGPMLPRGARRTADASALLLHFAQTAGGEGGARLAKRAGLVASPDTLLRLVRGSDEQEVSTPRVLGVDDLALRRRHRYATLLVDLEARRAIDLLDDRDAQTLATWLRAHPGVEIIVRDRSGAYAEGARIGAPAAVQVADRFHLVQNAGAALDELLRSRKQQVEYVAAQPAPSPPSEAEPRRPSATKARELARRAARVARWEQVRALRAAGKSICGIAREMGMNRRTVRHHLATAEPPRNRVLHPRAPRPGGLTSPTLQPHVSYLQDRWQAGCSNVGQLFRELVARGYQGSYSLLRVALHPWRPPRPPPRLRRRLGLRWLCLRPLDRLTSEERAVLARLLAEDAELALGYDLLRRFRAIMSDKDLAGLQPWLADAAASELPPFVSLANGILADRAAVEAALTLPWSTGPVDGHIHRVKLIKRQGYGRAKLDLLRRRILAA